ncbi:hypothetical protein Leryth_026490 [Lithospermum erythrorhizon]|nr:hypothetical protein Leryth_026490 [Lithospermum erythrorhizon]
MGATEHMVERKNEEEREEKTIHEKENIEEKDLEKGEVGEHHLPRGFHMSKMQRLSATNPLRLVVEGATRVASPIPTNNHRAPPPPSQPLAYPTPPPQPRGFDAPPPQPLATPIPQPTIASLNSRSYTNKISLFVFLVHFVLVFGLVGFLVFKGVQGLIEEGSNSKKKEIRVLRYLLPQVEASALLGITLAFIWQKAVRLWPKFMVHFILWSSFLLTLSAGILLICFQLPATQGVGVLFLLYSIGNGLYACWVTNRTRFCTKIFVKALDPVSKFSDINHPTYYMLSAAFIWMSLWILAVIGSFNFYFQPLVITVLVLSLAWTTEVMRNVVNITTSRVIALYYLRGMQSSSHFCLQRASSKNLGSACLGSLFVPTIEALRVVARGLNLLEGEDEFMFCCARCSLKVLNSIFKRGNGWAYVQIAAYGKGFVKASQDTWELFEKREMEPIVDSDMTSAICFLTGICTGTICAIAAASWTQAIHRDYTAIISVLSAFIGYLMTRIAMALPHACVCCYYVCYAENPDNRLFDETIPERINMIKSGRDIIIPTPRVPGHLAR